MKIRTGFVSNSSSSSFMIKKKNLTPEQIEKIRNYETEAAKFGMSHIGGWDIREFVEYGGTEECIAGDTYMDNFDMYDFLNNIGIEDEHIVGYSEHGTWPNES